MTLVIVMHLPDVKQSTVYVLQLHSPLRFVTCLLNNELSRI